MNSAHAVAFASFTWLVPAAVTLSKSVIIGACCFRTGAFEDCSSVSRLSRLFMKSTSLFNALILKASLFTLLCTTVSLIVSLSVPIFSTLLIIVPTSTSQNTYISFASTILIFTAISCSFEASERILLFIAFYHSIILNASLSYSPHFTSFIL